MRIIERMAARRPFLSLEFFPPRDRESWPKFFAEVEKLKALNPLFVSVTYGSGGGTQANTLDVVAHIKREMDLEPMAHLTCVGASGEALHGFLTAIADLGIDNVLALRGDPPKNRPDFSFEGQQFRHASDLVEFIRRHYPKMGVGVAGYPEIHPESPSFREDLRFMKHKLDCGGEFVVTQLFFDNRIYFNYVERLRELGATAPVIPGILPVMSIKSAKHILSLGGPVPGRFLLALEKAFEQGGDAEVKRYGIEYATRQVQGLIDGGAPGVHLYTLNQAEACLGIAKNVTLARSKG